MKTTIIALFALASFNALACMPELPALTQANHVQKALTSKSFNSQLLQQANRNPDVTIESIRPEGVVVMAVLSNNCIIRSTVKYDSVLGQCPAVKSVSSRTICPQ